MKSQLRLVIITTLGLLSNVACKNKEYNVKEDGIHIKVERSSGDDFSYQKEGSEEFYAPYPFNFSQITLNNELYDVLTVSKRIESGKSVLIEPVAVLTVKEANNLRTKVLLVMPTNENMRIFTSTDYMTFMVEHFSIKQIVENWYSNRYGLQGAQIDGWQPATRDIFINQD
jgi:hypothetical protein